MPAGAACWSAVSGKVSGYVATHCRSPVCANTTGKLRGRPQPTPVRRAAREPRTSRARLPDQHGRPVDLRGGAGLYVDQITFSCQGLSERGEYTGPITTLASVGGGAAAQAGHRCALELTGDRPYGTAGPNGLLGIWGNSLHTFGMMMNCGTRAEGLKRIPVPQRPPPRRLRRRQGCGIRLGKALFWDRQLGSDGVQACASCHFPRRRRLRSKNQISPGLLRPRRRQGQSRHDLPGRRRPQLPAEGLGYPFHQRQNPDDHYSPVVRNVNDFTSSQGVFNAVFATLPAPAGQAWDFSRLSTDPTFQVQWLYTRRSSRANTPRRRSMRCFNFRNFWDGRAQYLFNGVNPFGARDADARWWFQEMMSAAYVQRCRCASTTPASPRRPSARRRATSR